MFFFNHTWSQIVLTRNNAPNAERRYWFNKAKMNNISFKYNGIDTLWDFSNILLQNDSINKFFTRNSSFNAFPDISNQPDFSDSSFYKTDLEVYKITDSTYTSAYRQFIVPIGYQAIFINNYILKFPFTYNDSTSQNWQVAVNKRGLNNVKSDGYGTLVLPNQTYNNTLRVNTYKYEYNENIPFSTHYAKTENYWDIYDWYDVNNDMPVFSVVCYKTTTYQYGLYTNIYVDTTAYIYTRNEIYFHLTDISKSNIDNLNVYPNPASDNFSINFNSNFNDNCRFELIDLIGQQKHYIESKVVSHGENYFNIDITDIPAGVYLLKCSSDKKEYFVKKVLVE